MARPRVSIIYYSMYGHVYRLALEIKRGLEAAQCDVVLQQVAETLSSEQLSKMGAPTQKPADPIVDITDLAQADGLMFGMPTRFGMMCAQMKAFFDSTAEQWQARALMHKPAGIFFSTATQGGGQETTALTAITQLVHHGMVFVPLGYASPHLFDVTEVRGGSPYGAGTFAGGDGSRPPSTVELELAFTQGQEFGNFVKRILS